MHFSQPRSLVTVIFAVLLAFASFHADAQIVLKAGSSKKNANKGIQRAIVDFFPVPPGEIVFLPPPTIKIGPNETPIQLKKMSVTVAISGLESQTTTELTFFNPNGRVLEGNLEFPLPGGATVTGYALDIQGKMVDGVIVSKEKARVVLETEIRRGVDPGIVEHVKGNIFRTRLYPIPANGQRTVRVVSVAPLALYKEDAAMQVSLPVGVSVPELSLEVKVDSPEIQPQIGGFGNLTFSHLQNQWTARTTMKNVAPDNDLYINLPKLPARVVKVGEWSGEKYVSISDRPVTEKTGPMTGANRPERISIAWDASGSRKPEAVRKDRALLTELFKTWKELSVEIVVFRDRVEAPMAFTVKDGAAPALFAFLDQQAYDGGSNLSLLELKGASAKPWLLFTDGLATLGEALPSFGGAQVNVVVSDSTRDSALAQFLASATGGQLIDLGTTDTQHAVTLLANPGLTLLRVEAPAGAIDQVHSAFSAAAGRANVYARVLKDGAITLVYGFGNKETQRTTVQVSKAGASSDRLVARAWAAARAQELGVFADRNGAELVELGRKFGLVTPGTSLIVLERVSQYVEHEIVPPESMPEWREQYYSQLKSQLRIKNAQEKAKIDEVVGWWNDRVKWWEKKFPQKASWTSGPKGFGGGSSGGSSGGSGGGGMDGNRGSVLPPPPGSFDEGANDLAMEEESAQGAADFAAPAAPALAQGAESREPMPKNSEGGGRGEGSSAQIVVKEWNPSTPYLQEIETKGKAVAYQTYLQQKIQYGQSPGFYLDCAGVFFKTDKALALRVLSNLAELKIEDPALLRIYAWRLLEAGELDPAIGILERVLRLRAEEPQSYRDLALALGARMDRSRDIADGVRAAELFNRVLLGRWDRFAEVETIVVMELNHLLMRMEKIDSKSLKKVAFVDKRLRKLLDLDVRITMSWDADNTDMDLHVIEPSGEEAFYGHGLTSVGGLVSRDITQGYGPEEYVIHHALPGEYKIRSKYFGSQQQSIMGPVTVSVNVITNYGRANEKRELLTLRLSGVKDMVDIGSIKFGKDGAELGKTAAASTLTRAMVKKLKRGQSEKEIVALLGAPERRDGGSLTVLLYRLADGTQIRIALGPDLLWAREVLDGAEHDLL